MALVRSRCPACNINDAVHTGLAWGGNVLEGGLEVRGSGSFAVSKLMTDLKVGMAFVQ